MSKMSKARLKLAKNRANAKQHAEAELYIHIPHPRYHLKIMGQFLKNKQKSKRVFIHEIARLIIMKMKMKMKNRSQRYGKNRPRSRHGHKYNKQKSISV